MTLAASTVRTGPRFSHFWTHSHFSNIQATMKLAEYAVDVVNVVKIVDPTGKKRAAKG